MNALARTINKAKPDRNIKVSEDLLLLIDRAAKHCNTEGSHACRAAARKIRNGRAKITKAGDNYLVLLTQCYPGKVGLWTIQNLYHRAGKRSFKIRNYVAPGVSPTQYRAVIAACCLSALAGPKYEAPDIPGEYEIVANDED